MQIVGVQGPINLEDSSGEIVLRLVGGAVDIKDTSGQLRVSVAGAVTIRDTDGNISVETAPGLNVTDKESGEVMVRNVSGSVNVPSGIKVKRKS